MWLKRALLGYYAVSLAVMIVTASVTKDSIVSSRQHIVERLVFPSLDRRQQPFGNQTSVSETIRSISGSTETSKVPSPSIVLQTSVTGNTIAITTFGSISSLRSTPTDPTRPALTLNEPNNGYSSVLSISEIIGSKSVKSSAPSTAEQQPSEALTSSLFTLIQDTTPGNAALSTVFDITSIATSSVDVSQSSVTLEISLGTHNPTPEQTSPTSSAAISSPESLPVSSHILTSTFVEETLQPLSSSYVNSTSGSSDTSSGASTVFAPTSQVPVFKTSVVATNAPAEPTPDLTSVLTPNIGQQSPVVPSSSGFTGDPSPSSAFPESTSLLTLSSSHSSVESSFHIGEKLSTSMLQFTTAVITSSREISSSSVPIVIASEVVLPPLTSLASTPGPTIIRSNETRIIEIAQPPLSTTNLGTSAAFTTSAIQTPLPPSDEQSSQTLTGTSSLPFSTPLNSGRSSLVLSSEPTSWQSTSSAIVPDFPDATLSSHKISLSSTLVALPSETASTEPSSSEGLPIVSLTTIISSSVTFSSGVIASFVPSETASSSVAGSTFLGPETPLDISRSLTFLTSILSGTQPSFFKHVPSTIFNLQQSISGTIPASESRSGQSQTSFTWEPTSTTSSSTSAPRDSTLHPYSFGSTGQVFSSQSLISAVTPSLKTTVSSLLPTSESMSGSSPTSTASALTSSYILASTGVSFFASSVITTTVSLSAAPLPSLVVSDGTQAESIASTIPRTFTATFSTVYTSNIGSIASSFSSVTRAAVNQTDGLVSSIPSVAFPSTRSEMWIPASESLRSPSKPNSGANSTWSSQMQPSVRPSAGLPIWVNVTASSTVTLGITLSHSVLSTSLNTEAAISINTTQAGAIQASLTHEAANSTAISVPLTTQISVSSIQIDSVSFTSPSTSDIVSNKGGVDTEGTETSPATHTSTSTPSQSTAAGNPPPLTTSQAAGIAVGGTTCLLVAVIAAAFLARRYHAAKHRKRMSIGSVYPKVAYLYDPKTGGDSGSCEALMSGATGDSLSAGLGLGAFRGTPRRKQRHSTGTIPVYRFTSPGSTLADSIRDPAIQRYSEYARTDTANALSAAVAGYPGASRRSSSYTKHPSGATDPFDDRMIPSSTFAPFSPDDIQRPETQKAQSISDGKGGYSQMTVNPYAYLNIAASMYPPVSPYGYSPTKGSSTAYKVRRQTVDSDPFADPFEHDLLLQVDERNRTSDSVTIFAPSPNLMSPHTPRAPVGPKLPIRQPNGKASARSLLSPVAAKYMHKAQEVKIPRKSIASPVLVQVGASRSNRPSPVIKPFSPPPPAPEPLGWENIKRLSDKRSTPAPFNFASPAVTKNPIPSSHTRMKPSLTGAGQALLAGNGLPLTVTIPHRYNKSIGLEVPKMHCSSGLENEFQSSDPAVREKRSGELRFADPALIGKEF